MSLVSTKWLFENRERVKIIDSSWHLPSENRKSEDEYNAEHIDGAIYFDIDENSDKIQVYLICYQIKFNGKNNVQIGNIKQGYNCCL